MRVAGSRIAATRPRCAWRLLLLRMSKLQPAIVAASAFLGLAMALVMLTGPVACQECLAGAARISRLNFGAIGAIFYLGLLAALNVPQMARPAASALFLAAGAHLGLMSLLYRFEVACPLCLATGLGVTLGAVLLTAVSPGFRRTAGWFALLGFLGVNVAVAADRLIDLHQRESALSSAIEEARRRFTPADGRVALVVFNRDGCPACREFREVYVPRISRDFGPTVAVSFREAPARIPTPTMVVLPGTAVFVGNPEYPALRTTLLQATTGPRFD